jgi:RimJ/RimL family protein N-acetyltransferase
MWKAKLKDRREVSLRFLVAEDRDRLLDMFSSMSDGALEWSMAPYTMDVVQRWINNLPNLIALVAEYQSKIVGYASIYRFSHQRRKGIGDLGIYLHQDFHNVGLGTEMTKKLLLLAKKEKMHKIELDVIADNKNAIHLYENFGFQIEGVSKDSFYGSDGKYHDMVHMGLILKT